MSNQLPESITSTKLYTNSLGRKFKNRAEKEAAERLQACLASFRCKAAVVAAEIHKDLPDFTVHDITHLDALWEIADLIAGPSYHLTPVEAFAFGGAVLLHDLGMALATYPGGLGEIKKTKAWQDLLAAEKSRVELSTQGTCPDFADSIATASFLRNHHAEQASELARTSIGHPGGTQEFLIEDADIRSYYGRIVGQIAHSHWWPLGKLEQEFRRPVRPAAWCPSAWVLDPLKVAALLRAADIAHIDGRRAPRLLRVLRNPNNSSDVHWSFQEKLSKPGIREDALEYSSGASFSRKDAGAWWLAFDTLTHIDTELRSIDALFADQKQPRFAARRVAGIESPERLQQFLPTDRWLPADARIFVSDIPALVRSLGGTALYGKNARASVRELIQNSADAIRARRVLDNRAASWGEIRVKIGKLENDWWLEINDCGIGMSLEVLTKVLMDFGKSYWGSDLMRSELPGLQSTKFAPTGRYGIGFFSAFMLGEELSVKTRRFDSAKDETWILEFQKGVHARPIAREAERDEQLSEGGTQIRIKLSTPPELEHGLLWITSNKDETISPNPLGDLVREIAPALDVTIVAAYQGKESKINANYWLDCSNEEFIDHMGGRDWGQKWTAARKEKNKALGSKLVSVIKDDAGKVFGRAFIQPQSRFEPLASVNGHVTVGGFSASSMYSLGGVLLGEATKASRDAALPSVPLEVLAKWATEQGALHAGVLNEEQLLHTAEMVRRLGGDIKDLPVIKVNGKATNSSQFIELAKINKSAVIIYEYALEPLVNTKGFKFTHPLVLSASGGYSSIISSDRELHDWPEIPTIWGDHKNSFYARTPEGLACELLMRTWKVDFESIADQLNNYTDVTCVSIKGSVVPTNGTIIARSIKTTQPRKKIKAKATRKV